MPRAPKGGAKPAESPPGENPWKDYAEPIDLTPEAAKGEDPHDTPSPAPETPEGAPVPVEGSEAAGEAPVTQETLPEPEDNSVTGRIARGELDPEIEDGKIKVTPAKRARPSRAKPKAVEGKPDASLPGGEAKRAVLDFGSLAEEEEYLNVLWYGPEGVGKTTAALRAADHGKVLAVTAEGGLKRRALAKQGINVDNVVIWPRPGQEEDLTRENLEALGHRIRDDLRTDPGSWYAVVWDSGSAIGDTILRQVVAAEVEKDRAKPAHLRKETRADVFFTDRSDYGTMTSMFVPLVHQYRDLQCHFLITALERRDVDEDTGQVMYGPVFTPAVSSEVRASADIVLRVSQEDNDGQTVVVAATRPNPRYRAKDRFDATPHRMADPSFTRVLGYVEGTVEESNDPVQGTLPTGAGPAKSGKIVKNKEN